MIIRLTQGRDCVVDDDDWASVRRFKWVLLRRDALCYAVHYFATADGKRRAILMHRLLAFGWDASDLEIDHWDGDGLNNRRANLRKCAHSQNMKNRKLNSNSATGFKGVVTEPGRKYRARIVVDGKRIHLGTFEVPELAHEAYKTAATRLHGEFACFGQRSAAP